MTERRNVIAKINLQNAGIFIIKMNTCTFWNVIMFYHCDLRKYLASEGITYIIITLCILLILPNANCPNTCFRLHVVMRMPRIDPSQLLTTLSVLLAPDGGIRSADDVSILFFNSFLFLTYSPNLPSLLSPCLPVLRVRDVFPGSEFFHPRSRIQGQKDSGSRIRIKEFRFF
jgi:hypothetical protein